VRHELAASERARCGDTVLGALRAPALCAAPADKATFRARPRGERGRITPKVMHDRVELDLPLALSRKPG